MKYICKKCGAEFELEKGMKTCPSCGETIDYSEINSKKEQKTEDYIKIVEEYTKTENPTKLKRIIQSYKDVERELPNFDTVWKNFVHEAVGASEQKKDTELQTFLKNHAKEYDKEYGSDLFISVLQAYPKVASTADWEEAINTTYHNSGKFTGLCDYLVSYIIKTKKRSFAMDIFHNLSAKEEDGIEAGRIYIRALFTAEEISEEVFTVSSFNSGKAKKFVNEVSRYSKKYLKGENSVEVEETNVWNNYLASKKKQKKRNIIITIVILSIFVIATLSTFLYLNSVNKDTVNFTIDKVIETYYGDDLELTGFNVTYKKNSGEEVTEQITTKMLKGYDPEKVGQKQTVYVEFSGVQYAITIVVSEKKLAKPVLTKSGNFVTWEMVLNAENYSVYVNSATTPAETTTAYSYDLSKNKDHGELKITVRANASSNSNFNNSEMSDVLIVQKLDAPKNIKYEDGYLKWDKVEGATKYEISINKTPYNSSTNSLQIEFTEEYTDVSITAVGDETTVVGTADEKIYYYVLNPISNMKYENGTISWDADSKADLFKVYVDGNYWKEFSRKNFNISSDGFLSSFTEEMHKIEIISASSTVGVQDSIKLGFDVAIGNRIRIEDGAIKWDSVGTGATYFVTVNGEKKTLSLALLAIEGLEINEGNNLISVEASYDSKVIILETATFIKNAKPTISYANGNWVLENDDRISYKYDTEDWTNTLLDVSSIEEGSHTIKAVRNITSGSTLEIASDETTVTVYRLTAPVIEAYYGEIKATFDNTKYKLDLYYAEESSENYTHLNNLDDIVTAGNYKIKAKLIGTSENNEYDIFLESNYSNVIDVIKLDYPDVSYTAGETKVTSSSTNVKFYYELEGVETELAGGLIANLPAGIWDVYGRKTATSANELISAPTPANFRATVFNMAITLEIDKNSQSQINLRFEGCEGIDKLTFDAKFEYYNDSDNIIFTDNKTNVEASKPNPSSTRIVYVHNYRGPINNYDSSLQNSYYKIVITVKIKSGSSEQTLNGTYNVRAKQ